MEAIENGTAESLRWLCFVLNPKMDMPKVTDWSAVYAFADKQKITGICSPSLYPMKVEQTLLFQWLGIEQQIKERCYVLNKRIKELCNLLEEAGFRCCILKGQGNAEMYFDPLLRMPGDIDVWVDASEQSIQEYVRDLFPDAEKTRKHIKFPLFKDVPIDVHVTPLKFYCPKYHKRLQRWIEDNKKYQFEHKIHLKGIDREISVPTAKFNAVYQLGHMLIHLFDEGIGLRHIVDYYYVLKNLTLTNEERAESERTLASLGLLRFAKAVLWIEHDILGIPKDCVFLDPDEKHGRQLLEDILDGGNFGRYSQRYKGKNGFYWRGTIEAQRLLSMRYFSPCEAVFSLIRKMKSAVKHVVN